MLTIWEGDKATRGEFEDIQSTIFPADDVNDRELCLDNAGYVRIFKGSDEYNNYFSPTNLKAKVPKGYQVEIIYGKQVKFIRG